MPVYLLMVEFEPKGRKEFWPSGGGWDTLNPLIENLKEQLGSLGTTLRHVDPYAGDHPLDAVILIEFDMELRHFHVEAIEQQAVHQLMSGGYCHGMMDVYDPFRFGVIKELRHTIVGKTGLQKKGRKVVRESPEQILEEVNKHLIPMGGRITKVLPIEGHFDLTIILELGDDSKDKIDRVTRTIVDEFCVKQGYFRNIKLLPLASSSKETQHAVPAPNEASDDVETLVARVHFGDRTFEFHFSPNRQLWDFQKAFVQSIVEVRENRPQLREVLAQQLAPAKSHLPKEVTIGFSEGNLPADYTEKKNGYPLITVEHVLKDSEKIIARLWLEELWREISSTEKEEQIRRQRIPEQPNYCLEMAVAMGYAFMRGCLFIASAYDLYSKDGIQYTNMPFLIKSTIIGKNDAGCARLEREAVQKYLNARLPSSANPFVRPILERIFVPPMATPPTSLRIVLGPSADLFLAIHATTPAYVEEYFPNLEQQAESVQTLPGKTDDDWKREGYERYIQRMNFSDNVFFQKCTDVEHLKKELKKAMPQGQEIGQHIDFVKSIAEGPFNAVAWLSSEIGLVLWKAGKLYTDFPRVEGRPRATRGVVLACAISFADFPGENTAEYIFRNFASRLKQVLEEEKPVEPQSQVELGETLFELRRLEDARAELGKPLAKSERVNGLHLAMGKVMWKLNLLDDAEQHLREELKIDQSNGKAHFALGNIMATKSRQAESRRDILEAIRLGEEAVKEFEEADKASLKPKNVVLFLSMEKMRLRGLQESRGNQEPPQPPKEKKKRFGIF